MYEGRLKCVQDGSNSQEIAVDEKRKQKVRQKASGAHTFLLKIIGIFMYMRSDLNSSNCVFLESH